jgi:glutamyl/glutaminyl-tRNA synthetase
VQKSGARFDEQRLLWVNGHFIRALDNETIYTRCQDYWPTNAKNASEDYKKQVLALVQERLKYLAELPELTNFFFKDLPVNMELINENKQLKKFSHDELKAFLQNAKVCLETSDFSVESLTERLNNLLEETGQKPGVIFSLIRIATTQAPASPGLAETLAVLGKETSLRRIDQQLVAF